MYNVHPDIYNVPNPKHTCFFLQVDRFLLHKRTSSGSELIVKFDRLRLQAVGFIS